MITESIHLNEQLLTELSNGARSGESKIQELLDAGADPNARNDTKQHAMYFGLTALGIAAKKCSTKIVSLLLDNGARIDERDLFGNTALWVVTRLGFLDEMIFLLSKGADANIRLGSKPDEMTILIFSIMELKPSATEALIKAGVDLNGPTWKGMTPLTLATRIDSKRIIEMLVEGGADIEKSDDLKKTPMMYAKNFDERMYIEGQTGFLVRKLILMGANPFSAFRDPNELERHFPETGQGSDISWFPENLKQKISKMKRGASMFGI